LRPRIYAEFTCPFKDILAIYTLPDTRANRAVLSPRHLTPLQIATTSGNAMFATNWTN
jgi:hypothetical protein